MVSSKKNQVSIIHGFLYCFLFSGNLGRYIVYLCPTHPYHPISRCLSRCHHLTLRIVHLESVGRWTVAVAGCSGPWHRGPTRWDAPLEPLIRSDGPSAQIPPAAMMCPEDRRRSVDISRASGLSIVSIGMSRIPGSLGL